MEFKEFRDLQQQWIEQVFGSVNILYTVAVTPEKLWRIYLDAFPPGTNEVFRQRREYDCACCRKFIRDLGNVVAVKDGRICSIWGFTAGDDKFQPVVEALDRLVTTAPIDGIFVTREPRFGTEVNRESTATGQVITWNHFFYRMPSHLLLKGNKTLETVMATYRTNREVLQRSLEIISIDAIETVLDLISQNSLPKGEEWQGPIKRFLELKKEYEEGRTSDLNNWFWFKSVEVGPVVGRIKNHSIGTLLIDLSEGLDLDTAMRKYEKVVAGENYKRPTAIYTPKMVAEAKETIIELGLENSLSARFATLGDVSVTDVLFADRSVVPDMQGDAFDKLAQAVPVDPRSFNKVEEVPLERFVNEVLPRALSLSVLVENSHLPNLVSLIAPLDPEAPAITKWGNNYRWAYRGNMADSAMKQRVAALGGKTDGVLRFSIQWNDGKYPNLNDYDAHTHEPGGRLIYYGNKAQRHPSSGMLDVDIINPRVGVPAVENTIYTSLADMPEGLYEFKVHCYSHRGGTNGFAAEIEFDGEIHSFEYRKDIPYKTYVTVAKVRVSHSQGFEIVQSLPDSLAPQTCWGITTGQFVPVLGVMYSPNYWQGRGIGSRHVIFALKGCVNDTQPNGFFNEYLDERLMPYRKVMEALGREMCVQPSTEQLSGLGFATTKRNSLVVKVGGHVTRIIRVAF